MARPEGFEPPTTRLEGGCSIQLSYERIEEGKYILPLNCYTSFLSKLKQSPEQQGFVSRPDNSGRSAGYVTSGTLQSGYLLGNGDAISL